MPTVRYLSNQSYKGSKAEENSVDSVAVVNVFDVVPGQLFNKRADF